MFGLLMASNNVWLLAYGQMVNWWVHICTAVTLVAWTMCPVPAELSLSFSASEPVESHIHRFDTLGGNSPVDNSN